MVVHSLASKPSMPSSTSISIGDALSSSKLFIIKHVLFHLVGQLVIIIFLVFFRTFSTSFDDLRTFLTNACALVSTCLHVECFSTCLITSYNVCEKQAILLYFITSNISFIRLPSSSCSSLLSSSSEFSFS